MSISKAGQLWRETANWYVGTYTNLTRFIKPVAGLPVPVVSPDAGGAYTAAEQTLINEIKAAVNNNNLLLGNTQAGVNQCLSSIDEIKAALLTLAKIVGASVVARNSEQFRNAAPTLTAPGANDFGSFNNQGPNSSRVALGETQITTANVNTIVPKWSTPTGAPIFGVPTVVNDILYYGDATGMVYAVREQDGQAQILWQYKCDAIVLSAICVTADACIAFDFSGCVHVIERATGLSRFKVRPNPHPAAAFFGGQGTVDPVRGWVYFGVPSLQETLIALDYEGIYNDNGSLSGDSIAQAAPGVAQLTIASAPFTNDDLYREITITGATNASNNLRQAFIIAVLSPTTVLALGTVTAEVFPVAATFQISTPWARIIFGQQNDPPLFSYPYGGSFIGSAHAMDPADGKIKWSYYMINASNFTADPPGTVKLGSVVVANLPGSTFGYPPGVPSMDGFEVFNPAAKAQDVHGNPRYAMGPSGGDPWGNITYDAALDRVFIPTGEQQAPPFVAGATNGIVCLRASDGTKVWETNLSTDVDYPDIWDDGLRARGPNLKNGTITSISAPDADGFQTLVVALTPFVAADGKSGREIRIAGAAAQNNGAWAVAEYVSNNTVKILNPGGVAGGAVGTWILNRIYDLDIGGTPHIVITPNLTKYIVVGGKDGRVFVVNPTTGAIVAQKQLVQMGLFGGFQTAGVHLNDVVYLVGTNGAQVGREGTGTEVLNAALDITNNGPAVIVAVQISNAGVPTELWRASISDDTTPPIVIETGPHTGEELPGRNGFGCFAANGVIYIQPVLSTKLYAFNMTTGAQLAVKELGQYSSAVGCISNGKIYMPSGIYFPPNFRFPPQIGLLQPYGNFTILGLPD